jgi:hypothetical protein
MSRTKFIAAVSALAFTAAPAFAQTAPSTPAPAQGKVMPRHMTHPAPAHKMPKMAAVHPDMSADQLNAKELAAMQHGQPADSMSAPPAMPAK